LAFQGPPAWSPHLPDFPCCTLQDCRLQLLPGVWHVHPHSSVPALALGEREETLGTSNAPTNQLHVGTQCRRLVRSLSLRPSWLLASWADQTEPRLSLPKAATSGLPVLNSPRGLPDMTTAPNGELRRQDLHLQVQQLVSLRSLPWVPWVSVPHLHRDYAPRRLPPARLGSLHSTFASRYRACFTVFVVSPSGSWPGRSPQVTPGPLVTRSPIPGLRQGDSWLPQVPEFPL